MLRVASKILRIPLSIGSGVERPTTYLTGYRISIDRAKKVGFVLHAASVLNTGSSS